MIKKIYKRVDSTNSQARLLLERGEIIEPTWIQAEEQYMGKGLGKNVWESEAGKNITGSMLIFPDNIQADQQFDISILTSLALCDLLDLFLEDIKIKWPNDIYAGSGKIAGLLIEHAILGSKLQHSILGVGLNVNQLSFPEDLPNPVSLKLLLNKDLNLDEITSLLIACLENRLDQLETGHFDRMREEYLKRLYRYMEFAPYKSQEKWFKARIVNVDLFGNLMLETETGDIRKFGFKEVEFIAE